MIYYAVRIDDRLGKKFRRMPAGHLRQLWPDIALVFDHRGKGFAFDLMALMTLSLDEQFPSFSSIARRPSKLPILRRAVTMRVYLRCLRRPFPLFTSRKGYSYENQDQSKVAHIGSLGLSVVVLVRILLTLMADHSIGNSFCGKRILQYSLRREYREWVKVLTY